MIRFLHELRETRRLFLERKKQNQERCAREFPSEKGKGGIVGIFILVIVLLAILSWVAYDRN